MNDWYFYFCSICKLNKIRILVFKLFSANLAYGLQEYFDE